MSCDDKCMHIGHLVGPLRGRRGGDGLVGLGVQCLLTLGISWGDFGGGTYNRLKLNDSQHQIAILMLWG